MKRVFQLLLSVWTIGVCFTGCEQEPEVIVVTGISLSQQSLVLSENAQETLIATVLPEDATNKDISWTSSDPSVASVQDGVVTAHKAGTTVITVKSEDGGQTSSCEVSVESASIPVAGVSLNHTEITLVEGENATLIATIEPTDATNMSMSWLSSDPSVASVQDGVVTAHKAGTTVITVKSEDGGQTSSCEVSVVSVSRPVAGVSLDHTEISLVEGESTTLIATIEPTDATNMSLLWLSSDPSVASVQDGVVTAHMAGTAIIEVQTIDMGKTACCKVTVTEKIVKVESVFLNKTYLELYEGEEFSLVATVTPEKATNKTVTWTSSDETIVSVENGKVKGVNEGTAIITVKTEDGEKIATCEVVVSFINHPVESVSLDKDTIELKMGTSIILVAIVTPETATNKTIIWVSSDDTIATVVDGKVTAMKVGTAIITATTEDGGKTASCDVTVVMDIEDGGGIEGTEDEDWDI